MGSAQVQPLPDLRFSLWSVKTDLTSSRASGQGWGAITTLLTAAWERVPQPGKQVTAASFQDIKIGSIIKDHGIPRFTFLIRNPVPFILLLSKRELKVPMG